MAFIIPSGFIADITGKIGGTVFKRCRSGLTTTSIGHPTRRPRLGTYKQRDAFAWTNAAWRKLTPAQQEHFRQLKIFAQANSDFYGRQARASGAFQFFTQLFAPPLLWGITTAPHIPTYEIAPQLPPIAHYHFKSTYAIIAWDFNLAPLLAGEKAMLSFSYPIKPPGKTPRTWTQSRWTWNGPESRVNLGWFYYYNKEFPFDIIVDFRRWSPTKILSPPTVQKISIP